MYRVFRVPPAQASQADVVWKDDVVSRQSITAREAKSLGMTGDNRYVLVEGSEAGMARATELLKDTAKALAGAEGETGYPRFPGLAEGGGSGKGAMFRSCGIVTPGR